MTKFENYSTSGQPGENELLFLALGGLGVIGSNFYAYGYKGKWLVVDFGIGFAGDDIPGVDVLLPDPTFLEERKDDIVGLVLTHAHEDHVGALPYLFDKLNCPIYATPFTTNIAELKLKDGNFLSGCKIHTIETGGKFNVAPFDLEFVEMTHSIPEPQALVIRTNVGTVFHTGDWKIDEQPLIGHKIDIDRIKKIGKEGVLALVGDSTNVMTKGFSESEGDVRVGLMEVIAKLKGGVAVTCFASNIARLESIAYAAKANNRKVVLAGRSLWRMSECARKAGYLKDCPEFYEASDVSGESKKSLLYVCTGSQGESRAALARISRGDHRDITFGGSDTVIFSARAIPGNEVSIGEIQNSLISSGVHIITACDAPTPVHASGHGTRKEIKKIYEMLKPRFAVPMHGEALHLSRHAQLADDMGVESSHILENGKIISIKTDGVEEVDEVYTSIFAIDGNKITPVDSSAVRERRKMAFGGLVVISAVIDSEGSVLAPLQITAEGVAMPEERDRNEMLEGAEDVIERLSDKKVLSDSTIIEKVRVNVRKHLLNITGKKPQVKIHLTRVNL